MRGLLTRLRDAARKLPQRRRRAGVALAGVLVLAGAVALVVRASGGAGEDGGPTDRPPRAAGREQAGAAEFADPGPGGARRGRALPETRDPLVYARAFAVALWSYDTRRTDRAGREAALRAWTEHGGGYVDRASVDGAVPDAVTWQRMRRIRQHATGTTAEAHLPAAFRTELERDPHAIERAHVYAVTVTGHQRIAWDGGDSGRQEQAVTLAVRCRPACPCRLAGIAPVVAP